MPTILNFFRTWRRKARESRQQRSYNRIHGQSHSQQPPPPHRGGENFTSRTTGGASGQQQPPPSNPGPSLTPFATSFAEPPPPQPRRNSPRSIRRNSPRPRRRSSANSAEGVAGNAPRSTARTQTQRNRTRPAATAADNRRRRRRSEEEEENDTTMGQVLTSSLAGEQIPGGGGWRGRDSLADLGASIGQTYRYLAEERPEMLEEDAVRRAIELSLLDCALVLRRPGVGGRSHGKRRVTAGADELGAVLEGSGSGTSEEILRVQPGASLEEIRSAYRKRARETHPDKGGKEGEFEAVARAYRLLLNKADGKNNPMEQSMMDMNTSFAARAGGESALAIKTTAHWDNELREHKTLVQELFQSHGADVGAVVARQQFALERLGLAAREAGSRGRNEQDEVIRNSCFYLSLAVSYLSGIGVFASRTYTSGEGGRSMRTPIIDDENGEEDKNGGGDDEGDDDDEDDAEEDALRRADEAMTLDYALQLKRIIEAAVVSAHPEWAAEGLVGEEIQAFSDFLVYVLDSPTLASEWAVAIFDAASGFVDVYKGKNFPEDDEEWSRINTLTLRYEPGHYQPILPAGSDKTRPALKEVFDALNEENVIYVVTDGSA